MSNTPFHYIDGSMAFPAPFREDGAKFNNFVFTVDPKKLQQVCDQWFNIPSNGAVYYQPLLPVVLVSFAAYQGARPDVSPYKNWGYVPYKEVIFSIFTVRLIKKGGLWLADRVGALVPYIFVDDALAMVLGREVYGIPKMMGKIQLPEKMAGATQKYSVEALSTLQFNPNTAFKTLPIANIEEEVNTGTKAQPHRWEDAKIAFKEIKQLIFGKGHITLPDFDLLVEIEQVLLEQKLPFSSLRQLRSIDSSETAAYQSIIDFYAKMTHFTDAGLLHGNHTLHLSENALFPIAESLGLKDGQVADAAFWIDWNFLFEKGTDVWTNQEKMTFWELLKEKTRSLLPF